MKGVRLDRAGMAEMLKSSEVADAISELAHEVAVNATGSPSLSSRPEAEVKVETYTTDRAAAAVVVKHAAALGIEAKHGVLAKAARGAGLQVKTKRSTP